MPVSLKNLEWQVEWGVTVASINQYLDDAAPMKKNRAAQFDNTRRMPMDEWVERDGAPFCFHNLIERAFGNLSEAQYAFDCGDDPTPHLCDASNLADLALCLFVGDIA